MAFNLRNFDLNLLLIFDALMTERNVTRAANRVFLSQPAMSQALNRLRSLLDDPILIKTEKGLMPTPRALAMEQPAKEAIVQLQQWLYVPEPFDPINSDKKFILFTVEYFDFVLLPRLLRRLETAAPNIEFEVEFLDLYIPENEMASGHLDLVVTIDGMWEVPNRLRCEPLLRDDFVYLVRKDHPEIGDRVTLDQLETLRHVDYAEQPFSLRFGISAPSSFVNTWYKEQNLSRKVVCTAASSMSAAQVISGTDYIMTLPRPVAKILASALGLKTVEPPPDFPAFQLNLISHPLFEKDPANLWLRQQLLNVATELR